MLQFKLRTMFICITFGLLILGAITDHVYHSKRFSAKYSTLEERYSELLREKDEEVLARKVREVLMSIGKARSEEEYIEKVQIIDNLVVLIADCPPNNPDTFTLFVELWKSPPRPGSEVRLGRGLDAVIAKCGATSIPFVRKSLVDYDPDIRVLAVNTLDYLLGPAPNDHSLPLRYEVIPLPPHEARQLADPIRDAIARETDDWIRDKLQRQLQRVIASGPVERLKEVEVPSGAKMKRR